MAVAPLLRDATLSLSGIEKTYDMGAEKVRALRGVSLEIGDNEYVAVMGPSGSGKSTLMHLIGCLDTPTAGTYLLEGEDVGAVQIGEALHALDDLLEAAGSALDRARQFRAHGFQAGALFRRGVGGFFPEGIEGVDTAGDGGDR